MQNTRTWAKAMLDVTVQWPISCEQNLSHEEHNRIAWIGQAAVCLALGLPASVTKRCWWYLDKTLQDRANLAAERAIASWAERQSHA
jgi:hypothetical protein